MPIALGVAAAAPAEEAAVGDPIPYRRLETSDFRASAPPADLVVHGPHLEAASCLRIVWPADLPVVFETPGRSGTAGMVRARVAEPRFHAVFDRACSWWARSPQDRDSALQHEQVHFAIAEHFARELSTQQLARGGIGRVGATEQQALERVREQMRRLASRAMAAARLRHDAFDTEVRGDPSGVSQRAWYQRYVATLDAP